MGEGVGLVEGRRLNSSHDTGVSSAPSLKMPPISTLLEAKTSSVFALSSEVVLVVAVRSSWKSPVDGSRYQRYTSVRAPFVTALTVNVWEVWESKTEKSAPKFPTTTSCPVTGSISMLFPVWVPPVPANCRTHFDELESLKVWK